MSFPSSKRPPQPPQLRLFTGAALRGTSSSLSPAMTLCDFIEAWFIPIAILGEGSSAATEYLYRITATWWRELTGDPPLAQIDQFTISRFYTGLQQATFRRGRLGQPRRLSSDSIAAHMRRLRAVLNRVGPEQQADRATAKLFAERRWRIKVPKLHPEPKDCFELTIARQIVATAARMHTPRIEGVEVLEWWRGYLGLLYVTDLREGTVRQLSPDLLVKRDDGWWLKVPRALVPKTGKGKWIALPDWLAGVITRWPQRETIVAWPHCKDWLKTCHKALQAEAGIPKERQLPLQAWRRTHAREMQRLGAHLAIEVSRRSLDHGAASTTTAHYADITEELRRRLPPLWDETPPPDDRQLLLF